MTRNIRNNKYKNIISQNTERNYYKSNAHSISSSSHSSNFSSNTSLSEVQNCGFVTDGLRLYLEKYISENEMVNFHINNFFISCVFCIFIYCLFVYISLITHYCIIIC